MKSESGCLRKVFIYSFFKLLQGYEIRGPLSAGSLTKEQPSTVPIKYPTSLASLLAPLGALSFPLPEPRHADCGARVEDIFRPVDAAVVARALVERGLGRQSEAFLVGFGL